ncbi:MULTISPECIES: hypothetical protein [Microcystis]|uniref:Uncharacterized protein n=1 Tax=Microcystis panniformis FACHB-1757 TaxID=1638788 RepID=A0A0K1S886_9CHRO|nr:MULTISPECIES: hypothetical protein [Microcystis]AKV70238.1 hypothetical protein VL20_5398 [Microcystis panniformis FACHB-1757]MCZ8189134.1 hypothetical protein [Microcystis sp. LE19-338.1B]MCZ8356738.1 hypothetical protein [Microcystis sp. LE19-388.1G]TRT83437.1 MAG: hypothetical protein EWV66_22725 [Microcystis sp. M_OC_Ca_00000000_C217Col]
MPRPPKKTPSTPEPPEEPIKSTPPLQPLQIIKKGSRAAVPPKPPETPPEIIEEKPAEETVKSVSSEIKSPLRPRFDSAPLFRKPIPKAEIPVIEKATGANGEVFNLTDSVLITEPFGTRIPAIIDSFYADDQGEIWARLKPVEVNPDCRWEQACIRSQGLVKAE